MQKHKTFMQRKEDVKRDWHLVDLKGQVLGRASTEIAKLLIGKDKPTFTPHVDGGDYVVVVNASLVDVTRDKKNKKVYRWYTGFPGGLKEMVFKDMISNFPQRVIQRAVRNMLPKNKLRKQRMARMKIFPLESHPYEAQIKASQDK